jgi:hypothetical protein
MTFQGPDAFCSTQNEGKVKRSYDISAALVNANIMAKLCLLLLAAVVPAHTSQVGDIVFNNEVIKTDEIFDLVYAKDSVVSIDMQNQTKYYCVFRSNWNPVNQPAEYPKLARWGDPLMYSHTGQYAPFIKDRAATYGVQHVAEVRT